jgi:hypothetical protein
MTPVSYSLTRILQRARPISAAFVACLIALGALASLASADNARDYVEPRLTRQHFTNFTRQLELASDQRSFAELMFSDYTAALDDLTGDLEEKAAAAGLKPVQDALAGRARMAPDDLRARRVAILKIYQQGWETIDQELDNLLASVRTLLTPAQAAHFDEAARDLRRAVFLHPRQADSDFQEYAGDGVDVLQLADAALKDGGELQPLGDGPLELTLAAYELQLDELLVQSAAEHRNGKLLRKIAALEKNDASIRQLTEETVGRWKRLFQLNERAVQHIAQIAADTLGDEARQRWLHRFDHASFTWLYPRRLPDRQIEWLRSQSLDAETLQKSEAIYQEYINRRRDLSRQAIDIMLRARLEHQTILYAMMDSKTLDERLRRGLWEQLLKNSGEITNLETTTSNSLEALLTSAQRDGLRKAMQGPDRRR